MKLIRLLTVLIALPVSAAYADESKQSSEEDRYKMLDLFGTVFERVKSDYVEEVSDEELIEAAINGMLTSLDPHSSYLGGKDFQEVQIQTKGEFGGLGIEVTMENGLVKVVSPIDGTPADEVGIQAQDLISHIDGEPVLGTTLAEAVEKMRGPVGTPIKLTILREGATEPLEYELKRAVIKIQSVRSHAEGNVAYIRITSFSEQTYSGMSKALEDLRKEIGAEKIRGIVLDLRNNPGGLLDQAIEVTDAFLNEGEIVSTRGRAEGTAKRYNSRPGDLAEGLPIVVLVNGGSASASEIVSGALQDHKRAIIMGTETFGKGSVQTVIPLSAQGAMRLTTSRYYTPSGRSIQAEGIEPDIIVQPSKIEEVEAQPRRKESDLPGHLSNDKSGRDNATPPATIVTKPGEAVPLNDGAADQGDEAKDYQLRRAVDLLNGIDVYRSLVVKQ